MMTLIFFEQNKQISIHKNSTLNVCLKKSKISDTNVSNGISESRKKKKKVSAQNEALQVLKVHFFNFWL